MDLSTAKISIFTKPWKTLPVAQLIGLMRGMGFDGIEFPLRKGYQVEPEESIEKLPQLAARLKDEGLQIMSVAGTTDERTFEACRLSGVPIIRIMFFANLKQQGYLSWERQWLGELEQTAALCEKYGVKVGIQPHFGPGISGTMELKRLLDLCGNPYIGAIWDAAHSALAGEEPEQALDIIWEHLMLVNLKNAYYRKTGACGPDGAIFKPYFTAGDDGASSWPRIIRYLKAHGYEGEFCMPAEYDDEPNVERYAAQDLKYLKVLLKDA